ncbi:MAG: hypothetical protein HY909_02520 [Deltaproteobacteria bacterium]|nr:hypothetical protein [Deltaproteobacteria bacterium]
MGARRKGPDPALDPLRASALEHLGEAPLEGAPEPTAARPRRVVEPAVAALFPAGVVDLGELVTSAQRCWREATEREAPSLERLSAPGAVLRVEADAPSGYLAVVTEGDTWRAFVPRESLALVVALILRRPLEVVARELGRGPGALEP